MITCIKEKIIADGKVLRDYVALSSDTKPTPDDLCNGSSCREIDTGKIAYFNEEGSAWATAH